jgi:hypothetical protein
LTVARPVEIATYILASVIALGGGYVGAELVLGGETPEAQASPKPGAATAAIPAEGSEFRNARYGFSFRHPEGWRAAEIGHPNVVATVARADGVLCMVSVQERQLPSDGAGKPQQLGRMLGEVKAEHLTQAIPAAAGAKVSSLERGTLGGQEARSFTLDATVRPLVVLKVMGHATLRNFGAIVLMCMAPERLARASDVKRAFKLAHTSFRFD